MRRTRHVSFVTFKLGSPRRSNAIPSTKNRPQLANDELVFAIPLISLSLLEHVPNPFPTKVFPGKTFDSRWDNGSIWATGYSSPNHQMLVYQRRCQPIARSSSVHDLHRHEVFRANQLEFGPVIGQGFYGIARKVRDETHLQSSEWWTVFFLSLFVCKGHVEKNWADHGDERNKNIR